MLRVGGHVLFHDAVAAADFMSLQYAGPARVAAEIGAGLRPADGAGLARTLCSASLNECASCS